MKLSWSEKNTKKNMIRQNRALVFPMIKVPIADCFAGKPKKTISGDMVHVEFNHIDVGISKEDRFDNLLTWEHEFVEHVVGRLILEILVEDGFTLERMRNIIRDGIILRGANGSLYSPTVKHIMAALCTFSSIGGNIDTSPDEFAEFFGFKNGPVAQLDSAAPFEGVRSRFEFGRGLQLSYPVCSHCNNEWGYEVKLKNDGCKNSFWKVKDKL